MFVIVLFQTVLGAGALQEVVEKIDSFDSGRRGGCERVHFVSQMYGSRLTSSAFFIIDTMYVYVVPVRKCLCRIWKQMMTSHRVDVSLCADLLF